jgi:hypothetical protein
MAEHPPRDESPAQPGADEPSVAEHGSAEHGSGEHGSGESDWQRRRRLAAVFGDVLPDTTSDEREPETAAEASGEDAGDRWLRAQVPPHHG